ncbi:11807_t:CDS:2 [Diversispora eburnea]|uniref:11807_t:CDS:1 n=1 Tax=Diversispora eburnea TaxID=1213867 RepID=A0A9N8VD31_9GLOM|nr:11807_t:CDS:2 [Diversispora eburnea]
MSILVAEVLGSEVIVLGSKDFDKRIETGRWWDDLKSVTIKRFVKFYAPWCHHCKNLAPTWIKLAEEQGEYLGTKEFYIADVDCTLNGDVCDRNGVQGYPSLFLFDNGKKIKSYNENRSLGNLIKFSKAKAEELYTEPEPEPPENVVVPEEDIEIDLKTHEIDNSLVLPNPTGTVITLTNSNFDDLIGSGIWFIKFYAPWCGHCKKLAPTWEELGKVLKNKVNVGEVDCTTTQDLCKRFRIEGYPTLKLFQSADDKIDYKGSRKLQSLQEFAEKVTTVRITEITAEDLEEVKKNNDVFFIYYHDNSTPYKIMRTMKILSRYFFTVKFYSSKDKNLKSTLKIDKVPTLVAMKDGIYPASSIEDFNDRLELKDWIQTEKYPLVPAVTSENYEDILSGTRLVVLGILDPNQPQTFVTNQNLMKEVAKIYHQQAKERLSGDDKHVIFAWLDGNKWSDYVYGVYGLSQNDLPKVIISDPTENKYYDTSRTGEKISFENKKQLLESIYDSKTGYLTGKSTLGIIEKTFDETIFNHPLISLSFFVLIGGILWRYCSPLTRSDYERDYDKFE